MAQSLVDGVGGTAPSIWAATAISVTSVLPPENALDVPVSTNVTVTFTGAVDPVSVTTSSFRLLDPAQSPVPAQVSVGPSGLQATLDPDAALGFATLYTVELTDAIQNPGGGTLDPFTSQFATAAVPPMAELPDVAEQATPPQNATSARSGSALASAGGLPSSALPDLNGDGLADFIAGAPGIEVNGKVGVGAALVYLGSSDFGELVDPDIIFEGVSAHDGTGVSVAGNFDFNGDNIPDLLIGAEQVNRSGVDDPVAECDDGAPCGGGKVYLIYFDPLDLIHYPNLLDPMTPDVVDLSLVGGAIPGVVFTGDHGDQVGFDVAAGGRFNAGPGQDLAIGAPGSDPGTPPRADAGAVYVIFDDPSLSGTIALDRVANGEGDQIEGVIYRGGAAGDNLGFAVSFPGDVVGTAGDDLAMGAPGADPTTTTPPFFATELHSDGGAVFIPEGGNVVTGIIESDDVGGGTTGAMVVGDQSGMGLGSSIAGGGDNLVDGEKEILIGAPTFDGLDLVGQPVVDSGKVLHAASTLSYGVIEASWIGADPLVNPNAVNGASYLGDTPGGQLGTTVVGLGDVTGDGFDDVAFGAPFEDPIVDGSPVVEGGSVYIVSGLVPSELSLGAIPTSAIGETVAGETLVGAEPEEHASLALAATGDLDGDGDIDFLVGAPDNDFSAPEDNTGTVYIVLESEPELPGPCGPEGCIVAELETGTQIAVPSGSLSQTLSLAVRGVANAAGLPVAPPAGMSLLGAADFDPENLPFGLPLPKIAVPVRPGLEGQFAGGEQLGLWQFSGGSWITTGVNGTVEANPYYPNLRAIGVDVDQLHYYAVFITDADGDQFWDVLDSDTLDPTVCADTDGDTCDDCMSGTFDPTTDGVDVDGDGVCDLNDACVDVDADGVGNGNLGNTSCVTTTIDINDADSVQCADDDLDGCDDCTSGLYDLLNDGTDTDTDGLCDLGDTDDDNDGVVDASDSSPLDPTVCQDTDSDSCDDCAVGTDGLGPLADNDPLNDGTDTDTDGLCDLGDTDDDNDGVVDASDSSPLDPTVCQDTDSDSCDDCAVGTDGLGPLADNDPLNDGTDTDSDGLCDLGDPDDDNDGVADGADCLPLDAQVWSQPGAIVDMIFQQDADGTLIAWGAPLLPGSSVPLVYDTIRSNQPNDFMTTAECIENEGSDTQTTDSDPLAPGALAFYLVRSANVCGPGPTGLDNFGQPRAVISCP